MKTLIATAVAASALAAAAPALAQSSYSLGYSSVDTGPYNLGAVTGRYAWMPGNFGAELEASVGIDDDTVGANTAELNHQVGAFGVVQGELSPNWSVFGRAGYGQTELEINGVGVDDDGFAYGAGAVWTPGGGPNGLRAEYTKYDHDSLDSDVWSLSYLRRF
jgi:hypothetical protein